MLIEHEKLRTTDNDDNTANEMGQGIIVDHEELVTQETKASTWKKRAKHGKSDKEEWEKTRNKRQRMQGEKYLGLQNAQDGTYSYSVERGKRQLAPRNCSKRCKNVRKRKRRHFFQILEQHELGTKEGVCVS